MGRKEGGPSAEKIGLKPEGTKVAGAQGERGKFSWDHKKDAANKDREELVLALNVARSAVSSAGPIERRPHGMSIPEGSKANLTVEQTIALLAKEIVNIGKALERSENAQAEGKKTVSPEYGAEDWNKPKTVGPIHKDRITQLENALSQLQRLPDKSRTIAEMLDELETRVK